MMLQEAEFMVTEPVLDSESAITKPQHRCIKGRRSGPAGWNAGSRSGLTKLTVSLSQG